MHHKQHHLEGRSIISNRSVYFRATSILFEKRGIAKLCNLVFDEGN